MCKYNICIYVQKKQLYKFYLPVLLCRHLKMRYSGARWDIRGEFFYENRKEHNAYKKSKPDAFLGGADMHACNILGIKHGGRCSCRAC